MKVSQESIGGCREKRDGDWGFDERRYMERLVGNLRVLFGRRGGGPLNGDSRNKPAGTVEEVVLRDGTRIRATWVNPDDLPPAIRELDGKIRSELG